MSKHASHIPEKFHTLTAGLCVKNADKAVDFYQKAFGAELIQKPIAGPGGKIIHAELKIGDSIFFLSDEFPEMPNSGRSPLTLKGFTSAMYVYVPDVDASFKTAVAAGAKAGMPVTDMFWGDRYGNVIDPFGQVWGLATRKETLTPEQIVERQKMFFAGAR